MDEHPMPPARSSDERAHVWPSGHRIPRSPYRVVRPLGIGGMGLVYEVEDTRDRSRRALKALLRKHTNDADLLRRLEFEVRIMRSFPPHPNLPRVGGLFKTPDGVVCFDMDLLKGLSLRDTLRRSLQQFPPARAAGVTLDVLAALSVVHGAGYVHRDVKPTNIFLTEDGRAVLLDFGVAKALFDAPGRPLTAKEWFPGTANYMSPEYLNGKAVTPQFDVYAVGLVLWECLTGRAAFARKTFAQTSYAIISQGVPSLKTVGFHWLPQDFLLVVERATARDPRFRYPTADAFAEGLRAVLPQLASLAQATERAPTHAEEPRAVVEAPVITRREIPLPKAAGEPPPPRPVVAPTVGVGEGHVVRPDEGPRASPEPVVEPPPDDRAAQEASPWSEDEPSSDAGDAHGDRPSWVEDEGGEHAADSPPSYEAWDATELRFQEEGDATEVRSPSMLDVALFVGVGPEPPPDEHAGEGSSNEPASESTARRAELSAYLSTVDPFGDTEKGDVERALSADDPDVTPARGVRALAPPLEPTLRSHEGAAIEARVLQPPTGPDAPRKADDASGGASAGPDGQAVRPREAPPEPAARTTDAPSAQRDRDAGRPDGARTSEPSPEPTADSKPGADVLVVRKAGEELEDTDPFSKDWPIHLPPRPEFLIPPRPTWGLAHQARRIRERLAFEASLAARYGVKELKPAPLGTEEQRDGTASPGPAATAAPAPDSASPDSSSPSSAPPGSEEQGFFALLPDMETNLRNMAEEGEPVAPPEPPAANRPRRAGRLGGGLVAASRALFGVVRPISLLVASRAMRLLSAVLGLATGRLSSRPPPAALPAHSPTGQAAVKVGTSETVPPGPQPEERDST